jgi:hypothetical protein
MIRTFEKNGFHYTVKHVIDGDADWSYLAPESDDTPVEAEAKRARLHDLRMGRWYHIGVVVEIRKQTTSNWADGGLEVGRASVWGVESDSGQGHLDEIEADMVAEAEAEVERLREALTV